MILPDGTYDVFVVDARIDDPAAALDDRVTHLSLTVTAGEHKGEVVDLAARAMRGEEFDLIGMPATLTVTDGRPTIRIDA